VEDRISGLKDKIDTKDKTELLVKQLKSCERNMQELSDFIKRPNLRIMGIEKEEVKPKGMHDIFHKNKTRKFPKYQERVPHSGTGSLQDTKET
jgi:hypothetical protein